MHEAVTAFESFTRLPKICSPTCSTGDC